MRPYYIPRDKSWLDFNGRVLAEASNPHVPLYERIKFLAIFSSNLDEFFRVRISALRQFKKLRKKAKEQLPIKPKKILKEVLETINQQQDAFGRIFFEQIVPDLQANHIYLKQEAAYTKEEHQAAISYFKQHLAQQIHIYPLSSSAQIPFLNNRGLYFLVSIESESSPYLFAFPDVDRFVLLAEGKSTTISFIDDVIRANSKSLFPGQVIQEMISVKLSRDAEIYIDDEFSGDLLDKIKAGVSARNFGLPTRFLYDQSISNELLEQVVAIFDLGTQDLIPGGRYHNFHDLFSFPHIGSPDEQLVYAPKSPLDHKSYVKGTPLKSWIQAEDRFLHFPYHKFDYIPKLVEEMAEDESVEAIKITLYRIGNESRLIKSLIHASKKGKQVFVFIEAKARFDESSNMYWGQRLKEAGAQVVYSFPEIKVHAKTLQIQLRDGHYISYIGTGNFNEKNATIYTDFALLSADLTLGKDIAEVFALLEGKRVLPRHSKIKMAPFELRSFLEHHIRAEQEKAQLGQPAIIKAKLNNLEDDSIIALLIEAAHAGVQIELLVRGICCLDSAAHPNITIKRMVDRYLEHARMYYFHAGGDEIIYISSADWMSRNLDRRIEVACPIQQEKFKSYLLKIFDMQWQNKNKTGPHFESFENKTFIGGATAQDLIYKDLL